MPDPITKQQWTEIEDKLRTGMFSVVKFRYDGHAITVEKRFVAENQLALVVFIDGEIKGSWMMHEPRTIDDSRPAVVEHVWRKRTVALYSPAKKQKIIKQLGKRMAKETFPNMDKTFTHYVPDFPKARTLVRQFSKLPGIELVEEAP